MANPKDSIVKAIDKNGNGEIDIEDVIIMGLRVPGIRINRREFLQKELFKKAIGAPGSVAMVATIPADIAQYYGYMLRTTQKILYLYGFPEIDSYKL